MRRTWTFAGAILLVLGDAALAAAFPKTSVDVMAGATVLDPSLDEFHWDLSTRTSGVLQLRSRLGPYRVGARASRTGTSQSTGIPGERFAPDVTLTSFELVGERRVLGFLGVDVLAHLSGGRLHVSWDPDEALVDVPGLDEPVSVSYHPVDDWTVSGAIAMERALSSRLSTALEVGHTWFLLDVSRRDGDLVEISRESFGNWNARVGVSWHFIR